MSSTDRPEPAVEDGVETGSPCVALVPVIPAAQWSHGPGHRWPPNSTFVTQLIATAEPAPQAHGLRRATLADAQSAYNARQSLAGARCQTRQII
jgi:hypothetical protein